MRDLQPIFVIGAARSGTTLLANNLLSLDPRLIYTGEINFVWRYGAAFDKSEIRIAGCERDRTYIRDWFVRRAEKNKTNIILDKTPSNCLRVPFIRWVFPNAKFIHIVRDGRAASISARNEWSGYKSGALDSQKFRQAPKSSKLVQLMGRRSRLTDRVGDLRSAIELTADLRKGTDAVLRVLNPERVRLWGPKTPGLEEHLKRFSLLETCALQWEACVRLAHFHGAQLPADAYMLVNYENLLRAPQDVAGKVFSFAGLDLGTAPEKIHERLAVISDRGSAWRRAIGPEEMDKLNALIGPTLAAFGYLDWAGGARLTPAAERRLSPGESVQ